MRFGEFPVGEAAGVILAHTLRVGDATFRKGRCLTDDDVAALRAAGFSAVIAVRLDAGDLDENAAAERIAKAVAGDHVTLSAARTGRCNILSAARGIVMIDPDRVDRLNLVNEATTLSTVMPFSPVEEGDLVATVKIITFGVSGTVVAQCEASANDDGPPVGVAPFRPMKVGFVQTRLPALRARILDRQRP